MIETIETTTQLGWPAALAIASGVIAFAWVLVEIIRS